MKTCVPALSLAAGLLFAGAAFAAPPADTAASRIKVEFSEPEKFTDFRDSVFGTEKGREALIEELRDVLVTLGKRHVPANRILELRFTDIDLAGEFEPWRGPNFDHVRIVKDLYSPRLQFEYRIVDAATGAVVKQGEENMRDMAFLLNAARLPNHEPLRYERDMINEWLLDVFRPAR